MKPRALHLVAKPSLDEIREQSAREGKRVCDELRAEILSRDWAATWRWADKQKPVAVVDAPKRTWWK